MIDEENTAATIKYDRSLRQRVSLNRAILENNYWTLPVDDRGHQNFMPVGRGRKTSDKCGEWRSFMVCDNKELHQGVVVDGVDCTGKLSLLISICGVIVPSAQSVSFVVGV